MILHDVYVGTHVVYIRDKATSRTFFLIFFYNIMDFIVVLLSFHLMPIVVWTQIRDRYYHHRHFCKKLLDDIFQNEEGIQTSRTLRVCLSLMEKVFSSCFSFVQVVPLTHIKIQMTSNLITVGKRYLHIHKNDGRPGGCFNNTHHRRSTRENGSPTLTVDFSSTPERTVWH